MAGIHIVTSVKKSFFRKTYFQLSRDTDSTAWVRLRRNRRKGGLTFRPLRPITTHESLNLSFLYDSKSFKAPLLSPRKLFV